MPFHVKKEVTSALRRLAPIGLSTDILWTANLRTLRHVIEMRTAEGAEEEMRSVFDEIAQLMLREAPGCSRTSAAPRTAPGARHHKVWAPPATRFPSVRFREGHDSARPDGRREVGLRAARARRVSLLARSKTRRSARAGVVVLPAFAGDFALLEGGRWWFAGSPRPASGRRRRRAFAPVR